MELKMKKEEVLNIIVGKLISEGVSAKNYNTNDALMVLSHCVMPLKLQTYLVNYEEEVKMRLENLSQIKQKFTADEAEEHINQEVERRIKERMPSEEEITATAYNIMINHLTNGNPDRDFVKSTIGADDNKQWWANGVRWLRSRLTNPGVNDSQKTEGEENG